MSTSIFPATRTEFFIGGRWVAPRSRTTLEVRSANTGEPIGSVPAAGPADVAAAVAAARSAFDAPDGWAHQPASPRAAVLRRFADALDARAQAMAPLVSEQNGMPVFLAEAGDSRRPGHLLRYYADLLDGPDGAGEEIREGAGTGRTLVRRLPLGVVAAVVPWNFPNTMAALKYAPALAAGCTVVLKPSPETVLDTYLVAEAAVEAGLPEGVLNIVPGGRETGAHLVGHPGVDKVAFTGSTAAGRHIGEVCGHLLRPVTLELGGKSAAIVLDDADLDLPSAAPRLAPALFGNNGQTCFLTSRVLAPRSRYEEVVGTVAALARSLRVGNSLDPTTQVGPLVSERQRERVEEYIAQGVASDARLITGGGRPAGLRAGWFVEPTVFADVDPSHPIAREEIFGPVVTVTPYEDDDQAVELANDSEYGLAGTVWTADPDRGLAVARRIVTGSVGINHYTPDTTSPTTMIKASGVGLKFGPEALLSYQRYQSVYL
ncbi:aldehyde dehydrogenase [Streptomyces sp. NPDC002018]|uniref:aldehyde dehydrogenase n=1 Tax=Streptomyces sp. NPDC002018 TaxID=3364629 RepID=UPI0036B129FE